MARKKKQILIVPSTNTQSHLGRAFAIAAWLEAAGHETHLAFSAQHHGWAAPFHPRCHALQELWEPSGSSFPCLRWFTDLDHIERCVRSQEQVIQQVKPDAIIGIFDFISALSAGTIPRLCINGACMLPAYAGVLGFEDQESAARAEQRRLFDRFWACAGKAFHAAAAARGRPLPATAKALLDGDCNLLYEIPEVSRLRQPPPHYHFIGPIDWAGWESIGARLPWQREAHRPTVYLNCGTFPLEQQLVRTVIEAALRIGARVLVSGGTNQQQGPSDRLFFQPWLAPSAAAEVAELVISTGGIGVCYSNLRYGLPSLVIPMQPEQANNGLDLERAGCGRVLVKNRTYLGQSCQYIQALDLDHMDETLRDTLALRDRLTGLAPLREALQRYDTRQALLAHVERCL